MASQLIHELITISYTAFGATNSLPAVVIEERIDQTSIHSPSNHGPSPSLWRWLLSITEHAQPQTCLASYAERRLNAIFVSGRLCRLRILEGKRIFLT